MVVFTELHVWHVGLDLVKEVYALTKRFPREEQFSMTSQLRRAVTSILANVAEGSGRFTYADKAHKYTIARGECTEVEAYLWIGIHLDFISKTESSRAIDLAQQIGRMLSGLIAFCKQKSMN